jgi:hypothetical protein
VTSLRRICCCMRMAHLARLPCMIRIGVVCRSDGSASASCAVFLSAAPQALSPSAARPDLQPPTPSRPACPAADSLLLFPPPPLNPTVTPPGFFTANGTTSQCPPATYRAEWVPPDMAEQCVPCGENIKGSPTEEVAVIDPVSQETSYIKVQDSSSGCCEFSIVCRHDLCETAAGTPRRARLVPAQRWCGVVLAAHPAAVAAASAVLSPSRRP